MSIRTISGLLASLFAAAALAGAAAEPAVAGQAEAGPVKQRAAALVRQLGHDQFATRERATEQLILIGLPAGEALEQGRKDPDREIRYRSERILQIVHDMDFQRRLEAFASGDSHEDAGLPGWRQFRQLAGQAPDARLLFVEMQRAEPQLLQAIDQGPKAVSQTLSLRSLQLHHAMQVLREQSAPLGSVAALLFAAVDAEVSVPLEASQVLYSACYQASFRNALQSGPNKAVLRTMLGSWIRQSDDGLSHQALLLAMHHDMTEGVLLAEKILGQPELPGSHTSQFAVLTLAKLGSRQHIPLLESLLDDDTSLGTQRVNNQVVFETQIRDVALAALVHLADLPPEPFGFPRLQKNPQSVYSINSMGFENEGQRGRAQQQWKTRRSQSGDND